MTSVQQHTYPTNTKILRDGFRPHYGPPGLTNHITSLDWQIVPGFKCKPHFVNLTDSSTIQVLPH